MKKTRLLFLPVIAALLALVFLCGFTAPNHSDNLYVTDNSGVLSSEHSADIIKYSTALKNACGAEISVLTIATLDGADPAEYTTRVANEWGIGDEKKDNGILIMLATQDREIQVSIGSGLEGRLNDGKVGRLIDSYAIDYLKESDFDNGIYSLYKVLLSETMAEYEITELEGYVAEPAEDDEMPWWVILIILACVVSGRWWLPLLIGAGGRGGRGGFGGGFGGGGFGGGSGGGGGFSGGGSFGGGGFSGGGAGRGF